MSEKVPESQVKQVKKTQAEVSSFKNMVNKNQGVGKTLYTPKNSGSHVVFRDTYEVK